MINIISFEKYINRENNKLNEGIVLATVFAIIMIPVLFLAVNLFLNNETETFLLNHKEKDKTNKNEYDDIEESGKWLFSKLYNNKLTKIMMKIAKDPDYKDMLREKRRRNKYGLFNFHLDDIEKFKVIMDRHLSRHEIEYMEDMFDENGKGKKWIYKKIQDGGDIVLKSEEGETVIYFDIDDKHINESLKKKVDFYDIEVFEMKSDRDIVRDLARRLSFDKDVIKYLNTSRGKREIGWRELLADKLHGKNLDYINYITKTMVTDYNPRITGYIPINDKSEDDMDNNTKKEENDAYGEFDINDLLNNLRERIADIEDVLGIDPNDEETVKISRDKLGLNVEEDI